MARLFLGYICLLKLKNFLIFAARITIKTKREWCQQTLLEFPILLQHLYLMNSDCKIDVLRDHTKARDIIRQAVGNTKKYDIYANFATSKEFVDEYNANHKVPLDLNNPDGRSFLQSLKRYYYKKYPDIDASSELSDVETTDGFDSVETKNFAIQNAAHCISISAFKNALRGNEHDKQQYITTYQNIIEKTVQADLNTIKSQYATDERYKNILKKDISKNAKIELIFRAFGTFEQLNRYALHKNVIQNKEAFFREVFKNSNLAFLNEDKDQDEGDDKYEADTLDFQKGEDNSQNKEGELDDQNAHFNFDHSGTVSNFMMHIDGFLKSYFNAIPKITNFDGNNPNFDRNNPLGIKDYMEAKECISVLYGYGDFTSIASMIRSIREIADKVPGMQGFHLVAEQFSKDPDLAYHVYTAFGRTVMSKIQSKIGEVINVDISNKTANKEAYLIYEFINSAKSTFLNVDPVIHETTLGKIKHAFDSIKSTLQDDKTSTKNLASYIAKELKVFYPTIDENSVLTYIIKHNNGDKRKNVAFLLSILESTINHVKKTQDNYYKREYRIKLARDFNKKAKESDKIDIDAIYRESYLSDGLNGILRPFVLNIMDYSKIKTNLNSRNVINNMSSDVINDSMLTYMHHVLQNDVALSKYGTYKFRSRQYDFSNILLEHKDENGNVINYGLFKREGDKVVPTKYSKQLLRITLFDGAQNNDSNEAAVYKDMSEGDYLATAYINFFNTKKEYEDANDVEYANYFTRIPSDAPKTFVIKAPKYSARDLYIDNNTDETKAKVDDVYMSRVAPLIHTSQYFGQLLRNGDEVMMMTYLDIIGEKDRVGINTVARDFTTTQTIELDKKKYRNAINGSVYAEKRVFEDTNGILVTYYLKGVINVDKNKNVTAQNVKLYGTENVTQTVANAIKVRLRQELINSGDVKLEVNENHPLFNQLYAIALQELTDAANEINFIFENEQGRVNGANGIVYKNAKHKDGSDLTSLYEHYSYRNGKIVDENGNLTGRVFHSNKFNIVREDGTLYNPIENLICKGNIIDFLYGGDQSCVHFDGQRITLNQLQNNAVKDAIKEFITAYIEEGKQRIQRFTNFIPKGATHGMTIEDTIAEFVLNHHIMYCNFDDLFEGDSKFYKDNQDFLKRAKEIQGSGVPYGIVDYEFSLNDINIAQLDSETVASSLDTTPIIVNGKQVKLRKAFVGVTINNTVRDLKNTKEVEEGLRNANVNEDIIKDIMKGFKRIKTNDAQSYITFEEWIRRVTARGKLSQYRDLINKIQDESKPLDEESLKEFVQVQKNFYYDQWYDDEHGIFVPRQIKNAEFVLVPRFIKGTSLERVYNLMVENGIDQLNTKETDKAAKSRVLNLFDEKGELNEDYVKDFQSKVSKPNYKRLYNYNHLYTQQETPQHQKDTANKAGIQIMKKILDNIDPGDSRYNAKETILKAMSSKIRINHTRLMKKLNIKVNPDGTINNIDTIDKNKLMDRLQEEAARSGLDSNMMDYLTIDPATGETIMPDFMSIMSGKLENIAQSMFNRAITRQKLPGFHAAQVTDIGFDKVHALGSKELRYHPKDENGNDTNVIEVRLPFWCQSLFNARAKMNLSEEELIKQLQEIGADTFIGYRIPTEGKQSVAIMRVVGFLPAAYGSTIMVPDGWVAQTGSNFEIDSIYSIVHALACVNGKLYKKGIGKAYTKHRYIHYLTNSGYLTDEDIKDLNGNNYSTSEKKEIYDSIEKQVREEYKDKDEKTIIGMIQNLYRQKLNNKQNERLTYDIKQIVTRVNKEGNFLMTPKVFISLKEEQQILLSGNEEYINNLVADNMISIMKDNKSWEENTNQSKFTDITETRDFIESITNSTEAFKRKNRSPYNIFDQADSQSDVMSGAMLKGFSVSRDGFTSICNTVKPYISEEYRVRIAYNGEIKVHDKFGWSENGNRNVDGKLITAYSSQTTAHILDAVKEGTVTNVNEYTFGVYKTFADIGSNYRTGISFIMQPAVTRIVNAYNKSKSIYAEDKDYNPVHTVIKEIAMQLGLTVNNKFIDKSTNIEYVIAAIDRKYGLDIARIFNAKITPSSKNGKLEIVIKGANSRQRFNTVKLHDASFVNRLVYDADKQIERIAKGNSTKVHDLLYDLGICLQFENMHKFNTRITKLSMLLKPDKFGAKQTIFATNKTFGDIMNNYFDNTLQVDNKEILQSVYPDLYNKTDNGRYDKESPKTIKEIINDTDAAESSSYQSLYSFLKYSTLSSIMVNKTLFKTQQGQFKRIIEYTCRILGGIVDETNYKIIQQLALSSIYNNVEELKQNVTIDKDGKIVPIAGISPIEERNRIFGFNAAPTNNFEVIDISNPTIKEVRAFANLTPLQKVEWIKSHFSNAGVFNYLDTNAYNEYEVRRKGFTKQTITYQDDSSDIERVLHEFNKAFFNKNPLVKLAAIDLIKYAFQVEGFKMKRNGITKIIANKALLATHNQNGADIINSLNNMFDNDLDSRLSPYRLADLYVRSHSTERFIPIVRNNRIYGKYELSIRKYGMYVFNLRSQYDIELLKNKRIAKRLEIKDGTVDFELNNYVNIATNKTTTLYKAIYINNKESIVLHPLNLLEEGEIDEVSANPKNRVYATTEFYNRLIDDYDKNIIEDISALTIEQQDYYDTIREGYLDKGVKSSIPNLNFNINNYNGKNKAGIEEAKNVIIDHYSSNNATDEIYFRNEALTELLGYNIYGNLSSTVQTIEINGKERHFLIEHFDISEYIIPKRNKKSILRKLNEKYSRADLKTIVDDARVSFKENKNFGAGNNTIHVTELKPKLSINNVGGTTIVYSSIDSVAEETAEGATMVNDNVV